MDIELTTIKDITNNFCTELRNTLSNNGTDASGELSKSIKGIVKQDGKWVIISIQMEDYWKYVENGTKPHFPPIDAIKKWITIKPVLPRPLKNGKLPTTNQLAYLIGRKIAQKGTLPKPFFNPTLNDFDLVGKVYNEVLNLIEEQITKEIDKEL